jgi:hypothetical protein
MNKMNLEDMYIPATASHLMSDVLKAKRSKREGVGENEIAINEQVLVELFLLAGAWPTAQIQKMNKNESVNPGTVVMGVGVVDNQSYSRALPQVIVQEVEIAGGNLVKAIMNFKNYSLKEVAERYGGKSGAANLANFMAKSNNELAAVRDSTLRKLADALECPVDWLMVVREMNVDTDGQPSSKDTK